MRTKDIERQNGKWLMCRCQVDVIGQWQERKQILKLVLECGENIQCTYWCDDETFAIDIDKEIPEFFSIRQKDGYYQCKPEAAPKDEPVTEKNDDYWYEINLGKCRHGILCAVIEGWGLGVVVKSISDARLDKEALGVINKLAEFSMTGEVNA